MAKSSHSRRIRRSIFAVVGLFLLGACVLGTSFTLFDSRLRAETIPLSMQDQPPPQHGDGLWKIVLVLSASIGFPLGSYVLHTLNECGRLEDETN